MPQDLSDDKSLYPPYPKDRGMLWFYVEAARRPTPATRRPTPAMVLMR